MKTLGRILIILMVLAVVMGITYFIVTTSNLSTSANVPAFTRNTGGRFRPEGGFPDGGRPEFGGRGPRAGGWIFGMIKNMGLVALVVAFVVIPKNMWQKRSKQVSASAG